MNPNQYDFAIIGGDLRQVYLANELALNEKHIITYALLETHDVNYNSSITKASSLDNALENTTCIIAPIPLSKDGCNMNQSNLSFPLTLDSLLNSLHEGQSFFAGCIPENFKTRAEQKNVFVYDLMENDSLAIFNTIATAEGAICEAIKRSPLNLHHSKCAVLGYGRCGKTITNYLKGMFCNVTVFARNENDLALAGTIADNIHFLSELEEVAYKFNFIFNTIPDTILTARILKNLKPTTTIIDIASAPGGVDYNAGKALNINATLALGLPGKYSPLSSAQAIISVIENLQNKF